MDLAERNWKLFCNHYLRNWRGVWTRYSPGGQVIESFKSMRSLRGNADLTEIVQNNRYVYDDGRVEEKEWSFSKETGNLPDGLFHPRAPSMRCLFFDQGSAAWLDKKLVEGQGLPMELFLKNGSSRQSVCVFYSGDGTLRMLSSIREHAEVEPNRFTMAELSRAPLRPFGDDFRGTSVTIRPDLTTSAEVPAQLRWGWEGNEEFFFCNGVSLSCPPVVKVGVPFVIAANWLSSPSTLHQIAVMYDAAGAFSEATLDIVRNETATS
jgi:hypothetical protein